MEIIKNRRSIRKYKNKEISNELLLKILESARLAPSGSNTQPWKFIVVRNDDTKREIVKKDHNQTWMLSAPVFIVCVGDIRCRIKNTEELIELDENSSIPELKLVIRDMAIAIEHILLQAEECGLGSCWTGWYEQKEMRKVLNIPDDKYVCGVVTLGYADEAPKARNRKELNEIVCYEKWQ